MRISATTMVGRSSELTTLRDALTTCPDAGSAVFVLGEAGIGKSRLVKEAAAAADQAGTIVLRGRTGTVGPPVPYRPLAEALMSLARNGTEPTGPGLAPYRSVLAHLVPEWRPSGGTDASVSPLVLAEAVIRLTAAVGSHAGCLLVLEDLHDADAETLAVVEYLTDNISSQPTSLLVTARQEEGPTLDLVTALAARAGSTVVELARLTRQQSDELVSVCLDERPANLPAGLTDRLWDGGSGNPFFVEELLRHMVVTRRLDQDDRGWRLHHAAALDVPTSLVRGIAQRAERLGERGIDVLVAAAVLGRRFPVSVLQQMTGLDDHSLLVHLRAASSAQLVRPDDTEQDWYAFQHGLTADAILTMQSRAERQRCCRAAAEAVSALHPDLPGDWCQEAARLREQAGDLTESADLHLEAGRRAIRAGATGSAVTLLEKAAALVEVGHGGAHVRSEVTTTLLHALADSGQFERAVELARVLDAEGLDTHRRIAVALRLAWVAHVAGRWAEGREQTRTARELLADEPSLPLCAELHAIEASVTLESPGPDRYPRAEALALEALRLGEGLHLPAVEAQAWHLLGQVARERDLAESEDCFRRSRDIAERSRQPVWLVYATLGSAGNAWLAEGDTSGIRVAREQALAVGAIPLAQGMDGIEALHHVLCGEFDTAERLVSEALEAATRMQIGSVVRYLLMVRAAIAAHRTDRPAMEAALVEFSAAAGDRSPVGPLAVGLARVFCALLEEDRTLAMREIAVVRAAQDDHQDTFFLAGHHGLGLLLDEVAGTRPGTLSVGTASGMRWNRQFALLAEAVRLGRTGDHAGARARVEESGEAAASYPLARHLGLRLVGEAAARDGWGDAEGWLREAEGYFHDVDATAVAGACRKLLRGAGAPVRQRRNGTHLVPAELRARGVTVREYEVLVELRGRLANKVIATRLNISPRTVEKHVASLLLKTDCSDRAGLLLLDGPSAPGP